ncbi:cardiolipin synthase [Alkalihalobacillus oceani]|uniref:Cardiolipin synthase n=1 Tax=Halalkalibacter oceani TaxID=1653776 RepID=A0A9X2DPL2_9BACI|nr:cardiolipin synthase [Halalkalibacter oceani]MCM3714761.1 cardiolipin synthase [Halalkalibacter oceani]
MELFMMMMGIILFIVNLLFAVVIIFIERKDAGATWAWLMILMFIPFLGFIVYLFLGQNLTRRRMFDWEDMQKIGIEDAIASQMQQMRDSTISFDEPEMERYRDLIYMHLINNDALLTEKNEVDILVDGEEKFQTLLADIESAEHFIHLQYYIFRNDQLGKRIIRALEKKAKEGVKVRVLYDDLGSRKLRRKNFAEVVAHGGEVGVFFPSRLALINFRMNYRNHRKLVNIDGQIGYIGGFNVGNEYLGLKKKFGYWRDTHLRIKGPAVDAIQTRFILDWNQASKQHLIHYDPSYFPEKRTNGRAMIQIVSSGPDAEWEQVKNGYIKMIMSAKRSIYIQTPYFIPDQSLLDALRIACLSGKEVHLMIPNRPDHPFVYWATLSHVGELLKVGAKVYIYEKGFIHAKMIVIDSEVSSVGTANIDMRSFKLNFEVNAFLYDVDVAQKLVTYFEKDIHFSTELTQAKYNERSKIIRFKESISRLLSPIL